MFKQLNCVCFIRYAVYCFNFIVITFRPSHTPLMHFLRSRILESNMKINLDLTIYEVFQLLILVFGLKIRNLTNPSEIWTWLPLIQLGLLFSNCSYEMKLAWIIHVCPNSTFLLSRVFKLCRLMIFLTTISLSFYLFLIAVSPVAHLLALVITFILCSYITRNVSTWVSLLLIFLSNDIELHPGHQYHENLF